MDEIIEMMIRMEDDPHVCARYKETLDAAEFYDLDNEVTHTIAGQTLPMFVPVRELSRMETTLHDKEWKYKTYNGSLYPCKATEIEVCQALSDTMNPNAVSLAGLVADILAEG